MIGVRCFKALPVFYATNGPYFIRSFAGFRKKTVLTTLKKVNNLSAILKFGDSGTLDLHRSCKVFLSSVK